MPLGANKVALYGASADTGTAVLLSTATASSSASLEFTLPTAYKQVTFGFYNIAPATDTADFSFQVNASGQSGYNETMTTTYFQAYHKEDGTGGGLGYASTRDQAQGTAYQIIAPGMGSDADQSCAGKLNLFSPASTTYVKHFYAELENYYYGDFAQREMVAGYINVTAAITSIDFKMSSGNIATGTIKMWGIK